MKKLSMFSLLLALGLSACGSKKSACDDLAGKLCTGKDDATCKATKAWLDSEMTGPDGKKMSSDDADLGCKMILDDKDALASYQAQAADHAK